ncbi:MAG TPA: type III-A CRISPR-associated protein Cas10/Csm1 [Methylococcus sp.]|nr:type III-A CRISPR-associated protein Cas10/Csm1 [Methylococcus sp.]
MNEANRLNASCRLALAAYLHDLGKFAERARIPQAQERDAEGNTRQAVNEGLYCPSWDGRRTHIHAAYTAIGLDLLEAWLPELVGEDMTPFAPWREKNADDSLINAAAMHHRPQTFLQWIVATADRLASGFEREEFEGYNRASDEHEHRGRRLNHYTTRQETLLERIRLNDRTETSEWRYPLKALSPQSIFPVRAAECENDGKDEAQARYLELWNQLLDGVKRIPASHRHNLALWLDHFDSLWLTFTHVIPSATAGIAGNVRPDVSLYDHSKTTAALAVALWRYHHDRGDDAALIQEQLRAQWDRERRDAPEAQEAWEDEKFLLVQGDFTGIQNFIFAEGGSTQKRAAKLLRGRSFYVSLLTDLAALRVLDALDLPPTSQVLNAAGKFLIVAPNTAETVTRLREVQEELDRWFLEHTYGQSGLLLAWLSARAADFRHGEGKSSPFRSLTKRLFERLDSVKLRRFQLCGEQPASAVFEGFLDRFEHGECRIDGRSPGVVNIGEDTWVSELAADQIDTGKWLATQKRVLITRQPLKHYTLRLDVFGYRVNFTESEEDTGRFGNEARTGNLVRAWDFSLPESPDAPLWNGYARRHIDAYVPRFGEMNAWEADRYLGIENAEDFGPDPREPKTLNHLARDDRKLDENNRWIGVEALMTLKGDVDNLGLIFQKGLERPTFAKMAALSRQVNVFFTVYLPWLCQKDFPNTYTVFAGGDDFFLIGPWHSMIRLACRMREEFRRYVAGNPDIHFSAGLSMTKPGLPIRQLAELAESALDKAKSHNPSKIAPEPKNAVTCFGQTVSWDEFGELMRREAALERAAQDHALSTGYLYALLGYTDMAAELKSEEPRPEAALWHSHFAYRTRRLAETRYRDVEDREDRERKRRALQERLGVEIAGNGIEKHGAAYKIALFTYLYQQRD